MGRTPGSTNKAKAKWYEGISKSHPLTPVHSTGSTCLGCGAKMSMQPSVLGERCSKCFRINPNGQKVTGFGYQSNRFKVKELDGPRFNAAFMVIDYAV